MLPHRWSLTRSWGVVIGLPRLLVGPDTSTTSVLRVPTVLVTSIAGLIGASTTSRIRLPSTTSNIRRATTLLVLVMLVLLVLILIG